MDNLMGFNKYSFVVENYGDMSYDDMFDNNMLSSHVGCAIGRAYNSTASGSSDGAFANNYKRNGVIVGELITKIKNSGVFRGKGSNQIRDNFVEDINKYEKLKILRIIENNNSKLDICISFVFDDNEYYGIYKDFNDKLTKSSLKTEMSSIATKYMDFSYFMKLDNFLYNLIEDWFIPEKGYYTNLKEGNILYDDCGNTLSLKENDMIKIIGTNVYSDKDNEIRCKINNKNYSIKNKDYYYFNYFFEPKKEESF